MSIDVFESAIQPAGHFGAVFERADLTAFFYLLDLRMGQGGEIVATVNVQTETEMAPAAAARIAWAAQGDLVGLFLEESLCAVFDLTDPAAARAPSPTDLQRLSLKKH